VVCSFTDVTAQHELERQLQAQWERLRTTLEGTQTATWEWQVQTGVLTVDARWAEMLGWRADEAGRLDMRAYIELTQPDDLVAANAELKRHFAGEIEFFDIEARLRHRDGGWRWVRSRGRLARRSADGRPLMMFGTNEDITQRKLAEISASQTQAMLQGLFDMAPVGISLVDLDRARVVDFNAAFCQMLGHTRDSLLQAAMQSDHIAPEGREARVRHLAQAGETGRFGPCEGRLLHAGGQRIEVLMSGARVFGADGRPFVWSIVQDISRRKVMEAELRAAAETDALTGLPNRNVLMHRLAQLLERARREPGYQFALLFLDFDRFKLVNDTLGHDAGDELLVMLGQRLQASLPAAEAGSVSHSFVARFGGDEFVFVAAGIDGEREARAIAERLHGLLSASYPVKGHDIQSGVSIGIAMGDSGAGVPHALLRNADTAMFEAKRAGRRNTVVFDQAMHARLSRALHIEAGLRLAVERAEFTVLYQPIVDLETGRMSSVEALLRWRHPELGSVSPVEFIPIAEESGQIVAIGEWVLRQSCQQWACWQRQDAASAPWGMSVNLSRVQMVLGNRLLGVVRSALNEAGMPAAALQLEITEREVMKDPQAARELMLGLNAMGVRLAMDDFGTGTSSLGCLRDYPFDTIKIDKSFVTDLGRDPHVLAVAHATINVIENLGMASVAEGIEEPAEAAMLQAMGCRYGQGYLFARPLAADKLLAAMETPVA
jgi:diguanylate cyclase (GGDEF)-like protein/PAS domain S-box-containing protein